VAAGHKVRRSLAGDMQQLRKGTALGLLLYNFIVVVAGLVPVATKSKLKGTSLSF
jgi:hypothetical protein